MGTLSLHWACGTFMSLVMKDDMRDDAMKTGQLSSACTAKNCSKTSETSFCSKE